MKIESQVFDFLKDLRNNNNREWFNDNRKSYDLAKSSVLEFTESYIKKLGEIDKSIFEIEPKSCLFRINRDTRFSKNKDPYKSNMGIWITNGGKKSVKAGYYIHLEPGSSFIGGGKYQPDNEELKKIRTEIDYNYTDFQSILSSKTFRKSFSDINASKEVKLTRPPKGYEIDNPAIEYLKLKSFTATKNLADETVLADDFLNQACDIAESLKPLNDFLNSAIES